MASDPASTQPEPPARVSPAERRFVLIFGALVMLATSLPYLLGYALQGSDFRFTGFVFGVEDGNSYIAKMLSGWAGAYLFKSPYSVYPQCGLLFLFALFAARQAGCPARPARTTRGALSSFSHCCRDALDPGDLRFSGGFRPDGFLPPHRTGAGGSGWRFRLGFGRQRARGMAWLTPAGFYFPESFGFLGIYGVAHLPLGRALLLWALTAYLKLSRRVLAQNLQTRITDCSIWRLTVKLGALWLASGFFNPLCLLIGGLVIAVHLGGLLVKSRIRPAVVQALQPAAWRRLALCVLAAAALPGLLLAYNLAIALIDPYASQWNAQNRILSPHPAHYLFAYGLLIPYCWVGGRRLLREDFSTGWFLVGWLLAVPLLVTLPIDLQRRLTEGAWVAACALGIAAFEPPALRRSAEKPAWLDWRLALLLLAFPTTLFLLAGGVMSVLKPGPPRFITADQEGAFTYLQQTAPPGAVVLGAYATANPLPAWAPVRVLAGHGPESLHKTELLPRIQAFFEASTPAEQRAGLIDEFGIAYVVWGPAERALGGWQPAQAGYLEPIADFGDIALFRVMPTSP
ncbi:MAG: hypothetical protein M5U05_11900 [Anaerolineales bacterium]|nr:hypothetical protein [Anaerolineales bacterium]